MKLFKSLLNGFSKRSSSTLFYQKNELQRLVIKKKRGLQYLLSDGSGMQGAIDPKDPLKLVFRYQEAFLLHRFFSEDISSFVCIGVGTGTALQTVRSLYPECQITGIDIDAMVLEVAVTYFGCPSDQYTHLCCQDGVAYVNQNPEQVDLILVDAYYQEKIPSEFLSVSFIKSVCQKLAPNGTLCINIISPYQKGFESLEYIVVLEILLNFFPEVWVCPTSRFSRESQNILLYASFLSPVFQEIQFRGASSARLRDYQKWMFKAEFVL